MTLPLLLFFSLILSVFSQSQQDFVDISNHPNDDVGYIGTANVITSPSITITSSVCYGAKDTDSIDVLCDVLIGDFVVLSSAVDLEMVSLRRIDGDLKIESSSLLYLTGLERLEEVTGSVIMRDNLFMSISGLEKLGSVGGNVVIEGNQFLESLNGLQNLRRVGGSITIYDNRKIQEINYLNALTDVGSDFSIGGNNELQKIEILNFQVVGGSVVITDNVLLRSISLQSLQTIGNRLIITGNIVLTDINELNSLQSINGDPKLDLLNNGILICGDSLISLLSRFNYHYGLCGDGTLHISGELQHPRTFHSDVALQDTKIWIRARVQIRGQLISNSSTLNLENPLTIDRTLVLTNSTVIFQHIPSDSVDLIAGCVIADSNSVWKTNFTLAERKSHKNVTLLRTMNCSNANLNIQNSDECVDGYRETYEYNRNNFNVIFGSCESTIGMSWIWTLLIGIAVFLAVFLLLVFLVKPIRKVIFPYRDRKVRKLIRA